MSTCMCTSADHDWMRSTRLWPNNDHMATWARRSECLSKQNTRTSAERLGRHLSVQTQAGTHVKQKRQMGQDTQTYAQCNSHLVHLSSTFSQVMAQGKTLFSIPFTSCSPSQDKPLSAFMFSVSPALSDEIHLTRQMNLIRLRLSSK